MASPVRAMNDEGSRFQTSNLFVRSDETLATGRRVQIRTDKLSANAITTVLGPNKRHFIAFLIACLPEVESVYTMAQDDFLHVYTVVNAFDATVRKKIYEKELQIIDNFDKFDFDFNIISRGGRPLSEVINDPGLELSFQRSE
jgi:hypothetical protein